MAASRHCSEEPDLLKRVLSRNYVIVADGLPSFDDVTSCDDVTPSSHEATSSDDEDVLTTYVTKHKADQTSDVFVTEEDMGYTPHFSTSARITGSKDKITPANAQFFQKKNDNHFRYLSECTNDSWISDKEYHNESSRFAKQSQNSCSSSFLFQTPSSNFRTPFGDISNVSKGLVPCFRQDVSEAVSKAVRRDFPSTNSYTPNIITPLTNHSQRVTVDTGQNEHSLKSSRRFFRSVENASESVRRPTQLQLPCHETHDIAHNHGQGREMPLPWICVTPPSSPSEECIDQWGQDIPNSFDKLSPLPPQNPIRTVQSQSESLSFETSSAVNTSPALSHQKQTYIPSKCMRRERTTIFKQLSPRGRSTTLKQLSPRERSSTLKQLSPISKQLSPLSKQVSPLSKQMSPLSPQLSIVSPQLSSVSPQLPPLPPQLSPLSLQKSPLRQQIIIPRTPSPSELLCQQSPSELNTSPPLHPLKRRESLLRSKQSPNESMHLSPFPTPTRRRTSIAKDEASVAFNILTDHQEFLKRYRSSHSTLPVSPLVTNANIRSQDKLQKRQISSLSMNNLDSKFKHSDSLSEVKELTKQMSRSRVSTTPRSHRVVRRSDLKFGSLIGSGSFGSVHEGSLSGKPVAIKVVYKRRGSGVHREIVQAERLAFTLQLRHKNIVSVLAVNTSDGPRGDALIIMELVTSRTLQCLIDDDTKEITRRERIGFAQEIAAALTYLHTHHVAHLDVKPQNVLLTPRGQVKLADFGNLTRTRPGEAREEAEFTQLLGTLPYRAPELMKGAPPTAKADVFSLGITLWQMATRSSPHQGAVHHQLIYQVVKHARRPDVHAHGDDPWEVNYRDLYTACWKQSPDERPCAGQTSRRCVELVDMLM